MNRRILFVDDEPDVFYGIQRSLRTSFEITTSTSASDALKIVRSEAEFAVIVSDMRMPGMSGIELLTEVRLSKPHTVRIMLTGDNDQQTAIEAVNRGEVFRFLNKQCEPQILSSVLEQGVRQYQLHTAERELLTSTVQGSIKVLLDALSIAKPEAFGRTERIQRKVCEIAQKLMENEPWEIHTAALLSPLGCVAVPKSTLDKLVSGRELTRLEHAEYERHPELGAQLLAVIPRLEGVAQCVLYQNKNFDGSGFPVDARRGEDIPLGARILHLAIGIDDLQSRGLSDVAVLKNIRASVGRFDPALIALLEASKHASTAKTFRVPPDKLHIGLTIEEDVQNTQGVLLICRGQVVTAAIQKHLRHFFELGTLTTPVLVTSSLADKT